MSKYTMPLTSLQEGKVYTTKQGTKVQIMGVAATAPRVFIGLPDNTDTPRMYYEDGTSVVRQHSNLVFEYNRYSMLKRGDIIESVHSVNAGKVLRVYKGDGMLYQAGNQFNDNANTIPLDGELSWKKVGTYKVE